MEQYIINGRVENIRPENLADVLRIYPNARKVEEESTPTNSGFGGFFDWQNALYPVYTAAKELPVIGGAVEELGELYDKSKSNKTLNTISRIGGEYANALNTGLVTGSVLEEYLEVFNGKHSPEAIDAMIRAGDKLNKLPPSDIMIKFAEAVDKAGGGFFNGLLALNYL